MSKDQNSSSMQVFFGLTLWLFAVVPSITLGSDFAASILSYDRGGGVPFDFISFDDFTNAACALGPPTALTTSDSDFFISGNIPEGESVPVVPVFAPFRSFELVSIGAEGHLAVAFDHRVWDDPTNPYGLDFIVFGNTQLSGSESWSNRNPDDITVNGVIFPQEKGTVSVSQDGINWALIPDSPYADFGMAPTLGRQYDPEHVDSGLGEWNLWWGAPTDPTFPVDPAVVPSNLTGWTVTRLARHYGRSAGGTGYDISSVDLPVEPTNGMKWIQYVRVDNLDASGTVTPPEIDAFADVAPVEEYARWTLDHFDWLSDPDLRAADADPDEDLLPNLLEYALGRNPEFNEQEPAFRCFVADLGGTNRLELTYQVRSGLPEEMIQIRRAERLLGGDWLTNGVAQRVQVIDLANEMEEVTVRLESPGEIGFIRMQGDAP